jgi:hypothetical protein
MAISEEDIANVLKVIRACTPDDEGADALAGTTLECLRESLELEHLSNAEIREALLTLLNRGQGVRGELFGRDFPPPANA